MSFIIPVSAAIDVGSQSRYYRKNRWALKGDSQEEIDEKMSYYDNLEQLSLERPSYENYLQSVQNEAPDNYGELMTSGRWIFSNKLGGVNARHALRNTHCPVLAIWGDKDMYVDVDESYEVYTEELKKAGNSDVTLQIFPNANHSLIKAHRKQLVHKGVSFWWIMLKYVALGKDAFADGYFELLMDWLEKHSDLERKSTITFDSNKLCESI